MKEGYTFNLSEFTLTIQLEVFTMTASTHMAKTGRVYTPTSGTNERKNY